MHIFSSAESLAIFKPKSHLCHFVICESSAYSSSIAHNNSPKITAFYKRDKEQNCDPVSNLHVTLLVTLKSRAAFFSILLIAHIMPNNRVSLPKIKQKLLLIVSKNP